MTLISTVNTSSLIGIFKSCPELQAPCLRIYLHLPCTSPGIWFPSIRSPSSLFRSYTKLFVPWSKRSPHHQSETSGSLSVTSIPLACLLTRPPQASSHPRRLGQHHTAAARPTHLPHSCQTNTAPAFPTPSLRPHTPTRQHPPCVFPPNWPCIPLLP
ncbi:hypothetical protein GQ43DRAFT_47161 [Delitschia confertaspora ATCC 74209]|uniref:Uncharacterized protein n=1 Tax=Delitschia confertaspora ATCC 74209 TaxID=1513339 RepID=A0A9P4MVG0_9PLEO|nr:hypothetical protein GQ43DRAFT_47161 [Delitschia confertaspora ATCC 74209]